MPITSPSESESRKRDNCHVDVVIMESNNVNDGDGQNQAEDLVDGIGAVDAAAVVVDQDQSDKVATTTMAVEFKESRQNMPVPPNDVINDHTSHSASPKRPRLTLPGDGDNENANNGGDGGERKQKPQVDSDGDYDMKSVDTFDYNSSSDSEMGDVEDDNDETKNVNTMSRRFDVDLVVKSIERGEPVLEQVKGKDVVLVIGKTGTGKSTLMQAIAGRKLQEAEHVSSFIQQGSTVDTAAKVVYEAVDPLPGFEIGHAKMSKTAHIGCYTHNPGDSRPLLFIDSPGFEDTNGHEADIATSIMLSQVAKRCRSLRFVIMISYVSLLEDRGGAMRSVLRLIRSFAKDFEKEKQSFLFLFTHSNEIAGVPDSIEGARSCLQNEIVRTIEGTAEEETREVLEYIRKSLKRNWPFTNVFLPLKTNVSGLVSLINTKLKPGKDLPHLANSCGLTPASRLTLGGELQSRLQELRRNLDVADPQMDKVCEALKIFRYFDQYISTEDIRAAIQVVNSLLQDYISQQMKVIEIEVERGTSLDHDFGPTNVGVVNGALLRLQALKEYYSNQIDCDFILHRIKNELTKFQGTLMLGRGENFSGIHRCLAKMSSWSIGFPQFRTLYQCVVDHLASAIQYSTDASNVVINDHYLTMEPIQLEDNIRNLYVLWSVNEDAECLSCHIRDTNVAAASFQSKFENLLSIVNVWKGSVQSYCKGATREEENLHSVARLSVQVKRLKNSLEKYPLSSDLIDAINHLQMQLADELLESFNNFTSELNFEAIDKSPQRVEFILTRIQLASALFSDDGSGLGRSIQTMCYTIVGNIKSFVMKRVGEMNEMAHEAERGGLRNGFRDAGSIIGLRSFCWFDNFIPQEEKFVNNTCIKFERQYNDRFENIMNKVRRIFQEIEVSPIDSAEPSISRLKHIFPELKQISSFEQKMKRENLMEVEAKNMLEKYSETFVKSAETSTTHWRDIIYDIQSDVRRLEVATQKQEHHLNKMSLLEGIDPECDVVLNRLHTHIAKTSIGFTNQAKGVMKSKENYEEKLRFLQTANSLKKFTRVSEKMSDIGVLKDLARDSVANDAKLIEDLVSETSEWDEIDGLLTRFRGATILDNFTSNEATSRLRPLLQLREKKQEAVDNLIDQFIQDEDFQGIRNFLIPYAKSKDQIKKQKFKKWLGMIDSCLRSTVGIVNHNLQGHSMTDTTCQRVVTELGKLDQAKRNLKQYFNSKSDGINLEEEIKLARQDINDQVVSLLNGYDAASAKRDHQAMGITQHFLKIYCAHCKSYLLKKNMDRLNSSKRKYKAALKNVPKSMAEFFDSGFKNDKLGFLYTLATLKNASQCTCPRLEDLADLYARTSQSLIEELNRLFDSICAGLSKSNCYDDAIDVMFTLNRLLSRELKEHVVFSELSFKSEEKLVEWQNVKQDIDRNMEFGGSDAEEKLKQWKKLMNSLDPSSNINFLREMRQWYSGTSYHKKAEEIRRIISDRFAKGKKALNDSNHSLLNESIQILALIETYLGKHVTGADRNCKKLKQSAQETFLDICKQAQNVLQSEEKLQFEGMCFDYRGLILEVPCVMAHEACKKEFSLTNHLIYDALDSDINGITTSLDNFVYETLKSKIMKARKFGSFVADECSLLQECIKSCEHIDGEDSWLSKIFNFSHEHFNYGRNLANIKHFAILELKPSAKKKDINKAYKRLAKKFHPDKTGSSDSVMFRRVQEAKELLLGVVSSVDESEKPFGAMIKGIRSTLRQTVKVYLEEQRYERVEKVLFKLGDLKTLKSLVTPNLDHQEIEEEIHDLVRSHVSQVKIDVESNWSSKQYRALNDTITDLKLMEDSFKSYKNIFPSSWDDGGIVKTVEDEIEKLGSRAVGYLSTKKSAQQHKDDFRRCFLNMGHVLVELPLFKDCTKAIMCSVLEACLRFDWGYSFLFDFGLGLQRGDKSDSDADSHVAQTLVGEFSHFKEVMTMVWNEETSQKPAEDTVRGIKGQHRTSGRNRDLPVDKDALLRSFEIFDAEYKKLLGEYIEPEADLQKLVNKITALTETFRPINCTSGWNQNVKDQIPNIIAAVFCVFTVLKSGTSYNRLGSADGDTDMCQKLLMKPHNIQVLTLLSLFGCGSATTTGLDSYLMQIRTGEGKSMILGAAAVVLALLGFRVRCVCYSEYLSDRDYNLFQDVFDTFSVTQFVKYSKITTLSEDTTATKGDIRNLTEALLCGHLKQATVPQSDLNPSTSSRQDTRDMSVPQRQTRQSSRKKKKCNEQPEIPINETSIASSSPGCATIATTSTGRKEILLVDEVDVFFGANFYGQTYNQVTQIREPQIVSILNHIWNTNKRHSRRQRLVDIQNLSAYSHLLAKMPQFKSLIDAEITLMIDQVRKVDEEPYYLDRATDRIGYRIMDSISYEASYGYRTVFAYLQEAERGNLKNRDPTLEKALIMPVSCGQFSYANISPERILGVSGTLSALGTFEYDILSKYGVNKFMYVPSVYGESNFQFDRAGEGIRIDTSKSDYFHSITEQIQALTKRGKKRSVIVFFENNVRLKEFTESSFYGKLGRNKKLLTEDLNAGDKDFVISKAATSGHITISTAVFGRGTDFFCKDETVQKNGGVHIIQTFLSKEQSEEIQIQGRTARQGKKGSYQMILLDSDLEDQFGLPIGMKDNVSKNKWYQNLCSARDKRREGHIEIIKENLVDATEKDQATHLYFNDLLTNNKASATNRFKEIYTSFKKGSMPSSIDLDLAFALDVTGSMAPYAKAAVMTITSMLKGNGSVVEKLKIKFPDIEFHLRVGVLGYRDIGDGSQFIESVWQGNDHFTKNIGDAISFVETITRNPSGGGDIAEDHLGAIDLCTKWNSEDDWTSPIKFMLLLTDAPAHGMVPAGSKRVPNVDNYDVRHPTGLTVKSVMNSLIKNEIDLFICSFNPNATEVTEKQLSSVYTNLPENSDQREITSIPMVSAHQDLVMTHDHDGRAEVLGGHGKHIVFVLDQSGSMMHDWGGVVVAYNEYLARRKQNQSESDLVSVVQFDCSADITVNMMPISKAPSSLGFSGGGTQFQPAAQSASQLVSGSPASHTPIVVFMSDGGTCDAAAAAGTFSQLSRNIRHSHSSDLELHVIAFGSGASTSQLQQIAGSSRNGKLHTSADTAELSNIFVDIAGGGDVAEKLEAEIGKRISDAVSDKLSIEYFA